MSRKRVGRTLAVLLAVAAVPFTGVASASATEGSVPAEVANYLSTDLPADLTEFYGPGAGGSGIPFDETTKAAPASRVYEFTAGFSAGIDSEPVARRLNQWVSVVSLAGAPVGIATVGINDATVEPELADFSPSPGITAALTTLPETGMLVRDTPRGAWLLVDGDTVTPLFAGSSGLTAPTTVAAYRTLVAKAAAAADLAAAPVDESPNGLVIAGVLLLAIVLVLALESFYPSWRRRRVAAVVGSPVVEPSPAPEPAPVVLTKPAPKPRAKPAAAGTAPPATAAAKPAAAKSASARPTGGATAAAASKPRAARAQVEPASAETASEAVVPAKPRTPRAKPAASE